MADAHPAPPPSLEHVRKARKPLTNPHKAHKDSLSPLDKAACLITDRVGTMGFFLLILGWTVFWLGWNLLVSDKPVHVFWSHDPVNLRFDPGMAFVFYLFISNVIQILLMPLIMVGQNIRGPRLLTGARRATSTSTSRPRKRSRSSCSTWSTRTRSCWTW